MIAIVVVHSQCQGVLGWALDWLHESNGTSVSESWFPDDVEESQLVPGDEGELVVRMDGRCDRLDADDDHRLGQEVDGRKGDVLPLDGLGEVQDTGDIVGCTLHLLADHTAILAR